MGFLKALSNLFHAAGSEAETASWSAEEAAKNARTADKLLDRVDEEVEQRAQQTLDHVNDSLTRYGALEDKVTSLRKQVEVWTGKAQTAATKAKTYAKDSPDYTKWVALATDALKQKQTYEAQLKIYAEQLESVRGEHEEALALVEKMGFTKQQALSQRDVLQVESATAQAKIALADAQKTWGQGNGPGQLLTEAEGKVAELRARARSGAEIAAHMPRTAGDVSAEIARAESESSVQTELDKLLAS